MHQGMVIMRIKFLPLHVLLTLGACVRVTVVVCVCVSVTMLAATYLTWFIHWRQGAVKLLWCFQDMHCVDFVENTLFKSSGDIFWPPLPSSLLDKLSMDKRDSNGFVSWRLVCRCSDSSYNLADSSLVTVDYQLCFLPLTSLCVLNLLIWHTRGTAAYCVIACSRH